jgi:hypothetical protein
MSACYTSLTLGAAPPSAGRHFFKCAPLTWNPGSAPGVGIYYFYHGFGLKAFEGRHIRISYNGACNVICCPFPLYQECRIAERNHILWIIFWVKSLRNVNKKYIFIKFQCVDCFVCVVKIIYTYTRGGSRISS